jgi:DNA-binding NarL/FixJ family response regulator
MEPGLGPETSKQISEIFRTEHGRIVAGLIRRFGDIDLAEEAMGDALVVALEKWPVASGGAVFGAGVAAQILASSRGERSRDTSPAGGLTDRERDVLRLLAQGQNNRQIARSLNLSLKTVQNYVSRSLDKLQVSDRTQAALRARDEDLA